jgi:hypothetical protein
MAKSSTGKPVAKSKAVAKSSNGKPATKSSKKKTGKAVTTTTDPSPKAQTESPANATEHAITRRAYELYLARDSEPGHELDDWFQAEREIREAPPSSGV